MRLVVIESPYAGNIEANLQYTRRCLADSLSRREAPLAPHLLYTQVLDDLDPVQRWQGVEAGLAWSRAASATVVYTDLGISKGMQQAIDRAKAEGRTVIYRSLERGQCPEEGSSYES